MLTEGEYDILPYGLKNGLAIRPKKNDILVYVEDIWEQIYKTNICNNNFHSKSKIKNALRGLDFNLINIKDSRICKDTNHIKVIKQLREDVATLKPGKGNGVVLLNNKDYTTSFGNLFKVTKKFKSLESDNTNEDLTELPQHIT